MSLTLRLGLAICLAVLVAGCSTIENRIQSNPQIYGSLSPSDQGLVRSGQIRNGLSKSAVFLAWGRPDHIRYGNRRGHPYEAWVYTMTWNEVVPDFYPSFYDFGYYRRPGYWPYPRYSRFYGGFYGPLFDPFPDDIVSYEVPYKTAFFENERCTGWEYVR